VNPVHILASYSIKGGVGKTAAAVNLAWLAAREGARTLLWDLDPQGAATYYYRVRPAIRGGLRALQRKRRLQREIKATDFEDLDLLPADFSYRRMDLALSRESKPRQRLARILAAIGRDYDWIILDCPPGMTLVSENVFEAADAIAVPLVPTTLSLRAYDQLLAWRRRKQLTRLQLLPFFSMVERRKRLHRDLIAQVQKQRREVLQAEIPYSSILEQMGVYRQPVVQHAPESLAALSFRRLWNELKGKVVRGEG